MQFHAVRFVRKLLAGDPEPNRVVDALLERDMMQRSPADRDNFAASERRRDQLRQGGGGLVIQRGRTKVGGPLITSRRHAKAPRKAASGLTVVELIAVDPPREQIRIR